MSVKFHDYAGMDHDDADEENSQEYENLTQTQEATQPTQQASQPSQPPNPALDKHLWGCFQPCSANMTRIDLWRIHPRYTIGRSTEANEIVFTGPKISGRHAIILWDGSDAATSAVRVQDLSSNGTYINGVKIGKNASFILRDGAEITFGTTHPQYQNGGLEDFRFIYRHLASGPPLTGLYVNYDIAYELGKGSFASVRKALHRPSGRWYAVKMISPTKSVKRTNEPSTQDGLVREITIMEKLEHRNVCQLFETFFHEDGSINLVLELVEGGDLLEYILKTETGIPEIESRDITYQMCDAMAYIHSKGITHRDLKPENVLLTATRPPVIKIADFGLAKVVDNVTMLRTMCGTPSYLAPEVILNPPRGYNNLVDSWSAGVIVFSMLTNQGPFCEDTTLDFKERIRSRRIDWGTLDNHELSLEVFDFIRRLLQTNPDNRLSLTNALRHDWLAQHLPFHGVTPVNGPAADTAMSDVPDNLQRGDTMRPGMHRPGRLVRRQVSEDEDVNLPELSVEMMAYAGQGGYTGRVYY